MPGNICSNCIASKTNCLHTSGKRGKASNIYASQPAALDIGSRSWRKSEALDNDEHQPVRSKIDTILSQGIALPPEDLENTVMELAQYARALENAIRRSPAEGATQPSSEVEWAQDPDGMLTNHLALLSTESDHSRLRFYGKSSSIMLVKSTLDFKKGNRFNGRRRKEFWDLYDWQVRSGNVESRPKLRFPDKDFMLHLIEVFFYAVNAFFPVLVRSTFEKSIRDGLHEQNYHFGALLCVVCALACRFSSDPRVFDGNKYQEQSCGWQWFEQVHPIQPMIIVHPPSIYELQYYCISALYLYGTSTSEASWAILGLGVRLAQDIGLHRRTGKKPTLEDETRKRVFWAIAAMDILCSAALGRPRATQSEDFDQDLPVECDDEFWGADDTSFKQPAGKPFMPYWNCLLRLLGILGMAQRTIYSINRSLTYSQAVDQLDAMLDKWLEQIPKPLQWDTQRDGHDQVLLSQSASLYAAYYYVRILVHRPCALCPQPMSLAICVKAARRCIDMLDQQSKRSGMKLSFPHVHHALFTSAVVLILDSWVTPSEADRHRLDVLRSLSLLQRDEIRWQIAGRLSDLIQGLLELEDEREADRTLKRRKIEPREGSQPVSSRSAPQSPPSSASYETFPSTGSEYSVQSGSTESQYWWMQGTVYPDPHDAHIPTNWNPADATVGADSAYWPYNSMQQQGDWQSPPEQ